MSIEREQVELCPYAESMPDPVCVLAAALIEARAERDVFSGALDLQTDLFVKQGETEKALRTQLAAARVVDDADKLERAGRAIYEGLYAKDGGKWHAVETKHVWRGLAFAAITAALSEAP